MSHRWHSSEKAPFGMDLKVFGMEVPENGSDCAKCKFVDPDGDLECSNAGYIEWRSGKTGKEHDGSIPRSTTSFCCNNFKSSGREVTPRE